MTKEGADLDGYHLNVEDYMMFSVYGYYLHPNNISYLDSGVVNDTVWQRWWRLIGNLPTKYHDAPTGRAGRCFVKPSRASPEAWKEHT